MHFDTEVLQTLAALHQAGTPVVCVTLIAARGSVPQEIGTKLLVSNKGRIAGTVGGGRVEETAIRKAKELLEIQSESPCETVEWNLQRDIGMTCGGVVTLLFERFHRNAWQITLFGAGHVCQALTNLLSTLSCQVTVLDTREDLLAKILKSPQIQTRLIDPLVDAVDDIPEGAFVALMTQGHRTDFPVLERILKTRSFPYLGVIGSAAKAAVLRRELREAGVAEELQQNFRCPLGLPIGKDCPEEIAISIAAEFLQIRGN